MNRREFLQNGALFVAAPAIIKYSNLMPVKVYRDMFSLNGSVTHISDNLFAPLIEAAAKQKLEDFNKDLVWQIVSRLHPSEIERSMELFSLPNAK